MAARQPGFLKRGEPVRLQAFLARSGVASRRAAEEMITHGRIAVNGETVTAMGLTVVPGIDRVEVDGEEVKVAPTTWLALHKPKGYVTTRIDPYDRRTVYDLLPDKYHGLFHVGRLDRDSEGLLLLTNDGDLANRFLHPSFGITKEYDVVATGKPTDAALRQLVEGVELEDGMAQAESAKLMGPAGNGHSRLKLVLREGKKREVRRMLAALGHEVTSLVRQRFGPIELGELPKGKYRIVQPEELSHVRTPPKKEKARDTHGAYDAEKPRGKSAAKPAAKSAAARARPAADDGERRPRGKAAAAEGSAPVRGGARSGSRVDGDAPPKRAGGRAGTRLGTGSRFEADDRANKRRPGQEKRGRPVDPDAPPKRPRAPADAGRSDNEWDDAPAPRRDSADRPARPGARGGRDREYEDRGPARGARTGGARGGFGADRDSGPRRGSADREDRPSRSGSADRSGARGGRFGGEERGGGSRGGRFGGEERGGGSRGGRFGGEERGGGSRGGRFGGEERGGGSRGGRFGGEERGGGARGGRFGGADRGGSRGGRFGGEERAGGSRGGRFGGEERGGGSRGGRFGGEERGGSRGSRFDSEDRGGSRGVRPDATRTPPPVDDDRDELDEWSTAPRRPRAGATGGARGGRPGGARSGGGRPGAAGGARGGGSRAGGGRPGGARAGSRGGGEDGGGRPGGSRGGGGRPVGRPGGGGGRAGGGAGRGGRPGGRSGPRGGGGGRRG
jgi:23S rRNA pseudouridine2605 synthase